jgi:hypothetical protein
MAELFALLLEWFLDLLIYAAGSIFYDRFIEPYDIRATLFWLAVILGAAGFIWWELR